jgi:hypothetical protein
MNPDLKIKTLHVFPPIPIRSHDWCAWEDGADPESTHGWGATEEEAKANLIQQLEDEEE